jgi:hypothetical protein
MSTLQHLQAEIASRMRRGDAFDSVEDEVINASALPDAEKAALWLYGWSFVPWQRQRREAVAHIAQLADGDPSGERVVAMLRVAGAN